MKFIVKHLPLLIIATTACSEPPIVRHSYHFSNAKNLTNIEGEVYGLEEMDHYNSLTLESIIHELVDETKAKIKVEGRIKSITSGRKLVAESDQKQIFTAELDSPLQLNDTMVDKKCIFQGIGQMNENNENRTLEVQVQSMIILR